MHTVPQGGVIDYLWGESPLGNHHPTLWGDTDMFNTTAYGKAVVKYIQAVTYFQFLFELWSFGHVETVPMPNSLFRCCYFETLTLLNIVFCLLFFFEICFFGHVETVPMPISHLFLNVNF